MNNRTVNNSHEYKVFSIHIYKKQQHKTLLAKSTQRTLHILLNYSANILLVDLVKIFPPTLIAQYILLIVWQRIKKIIEEREENK